MGHAPAPRPWPPLPPPEGGEADRELGRLWRMMGQIPLYLCSSPTPPKTLWEGTDQHTTLFTQLSRCCECFMFYIKTKKTWILLKRLV